MQLKLDENGHVVVEDGKPVYTTDKGDVPFDAAHAVSKIAELSEKRDALREERDDLTSKLKPFDGVDPDKAKAALQTVKNLDAKKLLEADKVEQLTQEAIAETKRGFEKQLTEKDEVLSGKDAEIRTLTVSKAISESEYLKETIFDGIPAAAEKVFGEHFEYKDGKVIAKRANGTLIQSVKQPGDPASVDEALEILVSEHPQKDQLLKAKGHKGSAAPGGRIPGRQQPSQGEMSPMEKIKAGLEARV